MLLTAEGKPSSSRVVEYMFRFSVVLLGMLSVCINFFRSFRECTLVDVHRKTGLGLTLILSLNDRRHFAAEAVDNVEHDQQHYFGDQSSKYEGTGHSFQLNC